MTEAAGPLVVLGMHRSGTSTVTRLLGLVGAPLPRGAGRARRSNPSNPEGFWEVPALSRCNEEVLRALGGSWSAPPPLIDGWPSDVRLDGLRRRAGRLARRHLRPRGVVWKDPRLCLVLPFWARVVCDDAPVVLVMRNPLEVAASIRARNGLDPVVGLALWEHYQRAALAQAAGRPVIVIRYEQMVEQPARVAGDVQNWLAHVNYPTTNAGVDDRVAAFVRDGLRRNRHDDDDVERHPSLTESQRALHRVATALVGRHERLFVPPLVLPDTASVQLLEARREARLIRPASRSWRRRGRRWVLNGLSGMARSRPDRNR